MNWAASLAPMLVSWTPGDIAKWMHALYHQKAALSEHTLNEVLDFGDPVDGEPLMKVYGPGVVDINLGVLMPRWAPVRTYGVLAAGVSSALSGSRSAVFRHVFAFFHWWTRVVGTASLRRGHGHSSAVLLVLLAPTARRYQFASNGVTHACRKDTIYGNCLA